jgi:2-phosphosulfolactate phosphatase
METTTTDGGYQSQQGYRVRFERGERGAVALAERRSPAVAVMIVVDVLTFSTAVDVATARGAKIFPSHFRASAESGQLAKLYDALLAVPRPQRSDASPYTLSPATLDALPDGARLVLPSPNGARCVRAAYERQIPTIIVGCLRNASAVAAFAAARAGDRAIAVVAAGERWADGTLRPALEDDLGAGAILAALGRDATASPEACYITRAFHSGRESVAADIRASISGRELIESGYADDVERALQTDTSTNVPVLSTDGFFSAAA